MYTYLAQGNPATFPGATLVTGVDVVARRHRDVWPPVTLGAHRVNWQAQGGPIAAPNCAAVDAVATATASQTGLGVHVEEATDLGADDFVVVSGLTYCWGLVAGCWMGHTNTTAVVAHFNGNYDNGPAWQRIALALPANAGTSRAVIVLTSDSTQFDYDHFTPDFVDRLIDIGVSPEHILIYWSNTSGVQFVLKGDGTIGEYYGHNFL